MGGCSGITQAGERCRSIAITGSEYCHAHHPDRAEARQKAASRGGHRGGRGRPQPEFVRLQERFEELANQVLEGELDKSIAVVVGQLLQGARACLRDRLRAIEQEELITRLEAVEEEIEARRNRQWRA